jgi:GH15 family glucan-1,4-alpha-glucosidase
VNERVGYLPISDHGIVGDLHTTALIGADGTIDWYCCPRFDSPSVFGAILDARKGGFYRISPRRDCVHKQLYFPQTNVLLTRFLSEDGIGELQGFMPVDGQQRLVRRVACIRGEMEFSIEVEPRFDYGRQAHETHITERGAVFRSPSLTLTLHSPVPLERTESGVRGRLSLRAGQTASFVLATGAPEEVFSEERAMRDLDETIGYWRRWLSRSRYRGRWREMVNRSALALKLLIYEPTGALVAAPTTSLPEQLGGPRNWDYRFTWVRDASLSLDALMRLGFFDEATAFLGWIRARLAEAREGDSGPLQIMYGIDGRHELPEEELGHLEGYRGSAPVRIGNGAAGQRQLDIYGELIDSIYITHRHGEHIGHDAWSDVVRALDWLADHWDEPDEGIWETRGGRQDFTYSRTMSWTAFDRAVRMSIERGLPSDLGRWTSTRDAIYRQVMERGWDADRGAFVQHYGSKVLDASTLTMPLVGFVAPKDPRWLSTLDAIGDELVSDSLVRRYNVEAAPDGLRGAEGTFSICSFWYVEALALAGRLDEALYAFEKMLTYANHLGLYSEEIGPTGEALGNFPQAFTHLALVFAATALDRALA